MRLKNKVILITGGYTGIGQAISRACVKEGARVLLNGLRNEKGQGLVEELGSNSAAAITIDITKEEAPEILINEAIKKFGKLDAVVNNAAMIVSSNINTTDLAFMRKMLAINTLAPFAIIQAALPYLKETNGCVLNIGSITPGAENLIYWPIVYLKVL